MAELPSRAWPLNDHEMIEDMYVKESYWPGAVGPTVIYKISTPEKELYFDLDLVFDRDPNYPTVFISEFGKKDQHNLKGKHAFSENEINQYKHYLTEFFMIPKDIPTSFFRNGGTALEVKFDIC